MIDVIKINVLHTEPCTHKSLVQVTHYVEPAARKAWMKSYVDRQAWSYLHMTDVLPHPHCSGLAAPHLSLTTPLSKHRRMARHMRDGVDNLEPVQLFYGLAGPRACR